MRWLSSRPLCFFPSALPRTPQEGDGDKLRAAMKRIEQLQAELKTEQEGSSTYRRLATASDEALKDVQASMDELRTMLAEKEASSQKALQASDDAVRNRTHQHVRVCSCLTRSGGWLS